MKKYLAIRPIDMTTIAEEDIVESLAEFGCQAITIDGHYYATCRSIEALAQMMNVVDLPGAIVEFTGIYDSTETTTTNYME